MRMESKLHNKKELIKTIAAVLIAFAVYKCIGALFVSRINGGILNLFTGELVMLLCTLAAATYTKRIYCLKLTGKGFGTGLLVGIFIIVQSLMVLTMWVASVYMGVQSITVSAGLIVMLLVAVLMIGVAEELLFRGVLFNGLLDYFGERTVSDIRKAVVISGCIFGLLHLCNIFTGASVAGAAIQAVDAGISGMIFAVVYFRSGKNLWPGIVIHAFLDLCSFLQTGALMNVPLSQAISGYSPSILIMAAIKLLILLFLWRNKKMLPLLEKAENEDTVITDEKTV